MKELFEQLQNEKEELLIRWKDEGFFENLYLDFKELSSLGRQKLGNDDKKIIGRVLSGFSNSEGGTIVWGVNARSGSDDGIDTIQELKPFPSFERFQSIIYDLAVQFVSPKNQRIEIVSFPAKDDPSMGYVALWVGRGDQRPYMSLKDRCFYKRTGGSFIPMERFEIEDMFRAQVSPTLEVSHEFSFGEIGPNPVGQSGTASEFLPISITVKIVVQNISDTIAESPILSIIDVGGIGKTTGKVRAKKPPKLLIEGNASYISPGYYEDDNSLHPGQRKIFQSIVLECGLTRGGSMRFFDNGENYSLPPKLSVSFDLSCKNLKRETGIYKISPDSIKNELWNFVFQNEAKIPRPFSP